jgi:hypothetical protein
MRPPQADHADNAAPIRARQAMGNTIELNLDQGKCNHKNP